MDFSFAAALAALGPGAALRMMNEARQRSAYLLTEILPEREIGDYSVESGSLTVRPLMANAVAMDSPFPESFAMSASTFFAKIAKYANAMTLPEATLRQIQDLGRRTELTPGGNSLQAVAQEIFNIGGTVMAQSLGDRFEWLRAQALLGSINWSYSGGTLVVDYGIPTANKPAKRTGTSAYNGTASKWWDDNLLAQQLLRYSRRAILMHSATLTAIVNNPANSLVIVASQDVRPGIKRHQLARRIVENGVLVQSPNVLDNSGDIFTYDLEGEIRDPASTDGGTIKIPFIPGGKVIHIGNNAVNGYRVGAGSQTPSAVELGYFHIGPTVENGGATGPWSRIYTPEGRPWSLRAEVAANALPVVEAPEKIVVFDTDMPA